MTMTNSQHLFRVSQWATYERWALNYTYSKTTSTGMLDACMRRWRLSNKHNEKESYRFEGVEVRQMLEMIISQHTGSQVRKKLTQRRIDPRNTIVAASEESVRCGFTQCLLNPGNSAEKSQMHGMQTKLWRWLSECSTHQHSSVLRRKSFGKLSSFAICGTPQG